MEKVKSEGAYEKVLKIEMQNNTTNSWKTKNHKNVDFVYLNFLILKNVITAFLGFSREVVILECKWKQWFWGLCDVIHTSIEDLLWKISPSFKIDYLLLPIFKYLALSQLTCVKLIAYFLLELTLAISSEFQNILSLLFMGSWFGFWLRQAMVISFAFQKNGFEHWAQA